MRFDFGGNWEEYSKTYLDGARIQEAQADFNELFDGIELEGKSFIDIGFGQGLSLLIAASKGALATGCDINPKCYDVLNYVRDRFFSHIKKTDLNLHIGSILDAETVARLRESATAGYDVVHSWGVLHHTGDMNRAILNSASLVKKNGLFVLAVYNPCWGNKIWLSVKYVYNKSSSFIKKMLVMFFVPIIYVMKLLVTRKNPLTKKRGMSFYYDVVDWIGGYPYEYASKQEIVEMLAVEGFELIKYVESEVPIGCNEYIFKRKQESVADIDV